MVKKIAEKFNRLSRVHQRHRQTDNRQTDNDGRLIAYSERNVVRSLKSVCRLGFCKSPDHVEQLTFIKCPPMILTRHWEGESYVKRRQLPVDVGRKYLS